jgi:hypothetical protein
MLDGATEFGHKLFSVVLVLFAMKPVAFQDSIALKDQRSETITDAVVPIVNKLQEHNFIVTALMKRPF